MSENAPEPAAEPVEDQAVSQDNGGDSAANEGEPGTVAAEELGAPGEAEPMPADDAAAPDTGPDQLGADAEDTTDDNPETVDPGTGA